MSRSEAANTNDWRPRGCEVPGCPNPAGHGLQCCEEHPRHAVVPATRQEALAHLLKRLAYHLHYWPDLDRADSLALHGSYEIAALQMVLEATEASTGPPARLG